MAKPLLDGIFKVVALLMGASKDPRIGTPLWSDEFADGWYQGRKALADEILKELNVDVS